MWPGLGYSKAKSSPGQSVWPSGLHQWNETVFVGIGERGKPQTASPKYVKTTLNCWHKVVRKLSDPSLGRNGFQDGVLVCQLVGNQEIWLAEGPLQTRKRKHTASCGSLLCTAGPFPGFSRSSLPWISFVGIRDFLYMGLLDVHWSFNEIPKDKNVGYF